MTGRTRRTRKQGGTGAAAPGMPKRTKEEKAAAKAERAAKRQRGRPTPDAAAAGDAAASSAELLETVSLAELTRLRNQPSVANADSEDEDGGGGSGEEQEERAVAARVGLRREKGERLLKSGQHAKALRSFQAALELQPDNAELQMLATAARQGAPMKRKKAPSAATGDEVTTAVDGQEEGLETGRETKEEAKKKKKKKKKKAKQETEAKSTSTDATAAVAPLGKALVDIGAIEAKRAERLNSCGIVVIGPSVNGQPGAWCSVAPMDSFTGAVGGSHGCLEPELVARLARYERPTAVCTPYKKEGTAAMCGVHLLRTGRRVA